MDIRAMEESFAKASGFLLCVKGGCIMATIRDMLDTKIKHELNSMVSPKKKKKKKINKLTNRDLKELMGIDRPTYRKVSGKIKQR